MHRFQQVHRTASHLLVSGRHLYSWLPSLEDTVSPVAVLGSLALFYPLLRENVRRQLVRLYLAFDQHASSN